MAAPPMEAKPGPDEDAGGSSHLTKSLSRMSINGPYSPAAKPYAASNASPKSPSLSRKASSTFQRRPDDQPSPRRFSSGTQAGPQHLTPPASEEKPPITAASIAKEHFQKELLYHLGSEMQETDTLVLTHDACYGHRFSRPKTSKAILWSIFERPERIQAGMLGVATAYVRLGERHSGGSHPPHPSHAPTVNAPFRIRKTARTVPITSPTVTAVHGTKWMQELKTMCDVAGEKLAVGAKELTRPETPNAPGSLPKPYLHEGDLYLCKESLNAFEGALGGVFEAVDTVFDDGDGKNCKKAFVCIRPPGHHCSADWPSGFCWINNVHVGIEHAIQNHGLTHAAIIDFDLHHGDGSQAIAWERNAGSVKAQKSTAKGAAFKRSSVGYFSIHDINSYPCEDGDFNKVQRASVCIENAHGQNVWNVHLQPWSTEEDFWKLYETQYLILLDKARRYLRDTTQRLKATASNVKPKAAIFISAGFDASEWETPSMQRHKVNVPTEFYARMTSDIVAMAQEEGLATEGRVISVLEGGYSDRAISSGVLSHISGLVGRGTVKQEEFAPPIAEGPVQRWNPQWWTEVALRELENMMKPLAPPPTAPVKKVSGAKEVPTYQTPTQSFTAKVIDPNRIQRHTSFNMPTPPKSRPTTPPPPEVDWAIATCQLLKLLIPSDDRQVNSCRHEELNEPKRRERHSSIGIQSVPVETAGERRQTRGRKTQKEAAAGAEQDDRRQTISQLPVHLEVADGASDADMTTAPVTSAKFTKPLSRPQVKARQVSNGAASSLNVTKTRRTSLAKEGLGKPAAGVPGIPNPAKPTNVKDASEESNKADVDALTSGMKKISLKLPNPDHPSEAVASQKKAARKPPVQRGIKAATKPAVPKTAKVPLAKQPEPQQPMLAAATSLPAGIEIDNVATNDITVTSEPDTTRDHTHQSSGAINNSAAVSESTAGHSMPTLQHQDSVGGTSEYFSAPSMEPSISPPPSEMDIIPDSQDDPSLAELQTTRTLTQPPADAGHEFIPYQPAKMNDEQKLAASNFRQEPIQWLPPNTGTPKKQPASGKENLPSFTATGHIPFRSAVANDARTSGDEITPSGPADEPPMKQETEANLGHGLNDSVWDVPITPRAP